MEIMRLRLTAAFLFSLSLASYSEDNTSRIRKAIERSTLDQPGTPPFHLKATLAPSFERDRGSDRTGTIEIWWASPTQWKHELSSPGFHLTEVTNGSQHWQRTEGDFFPEWLRELAVAVVKPVPDPDLLYTHLKTAEVTSSSGTTHCSWMEFSSNGTVSKAMGAAISITDSSGLLDYGSGFGWDFLNKDYKSFHKYLIARTVAGGSVGPEVTAKITTLEDLSASPSTLFDTTQPNADPNPLRTLPIDEAALRQNLLPMPNSAWPALKDGPLEGVLTTTIVVDRNGQVRDIGTLVSDNPGINDAARDHIASMRFHPYQQNGQLVQVLSRVTLAFKTTRPAGVETFDSARNYFEQGRRLTSPAASINTSPYILHATFQAGTKEGVQEGEYTDSWLSPTQWSREATLGKSRLVRSQNGEKTYLFSQGPDASLLQIILKSIESIPSIDTFVESDWRITRQTIDGNSLIRVASGHESTDGTLDPQSRGLWFNAEGLLIRSHFRGLDMIQSQFQDLHGVQVPHQIDVQANGKLAIRIRVTAIQSDPKLSPGSFTLSGHDWKRQFTDEAR